MIVNKNKTEAVKMNITIIKELKVVKTPKVIKSDIHYNPLSNEDKRKLDEGYGKIKRVNWN